MRSSPTTSWTNATSRCARCAWSKRASSRSFPASTIGALIIRDMTSRRSAAPPPRVPSRICVLNKRTSYRWLRGSVAAFCFAVLERVGRPDAALTLVFIKAREMRALNLRHRARDYATDVLSFAYPEEKIDGVPFLGEVVVAPEVAAGNARARGSAVEAEVRRIIGHGILHLAGYDHATD